MGRSAVIICRKEIFLLFLMFMGIIFSFAQKTIITDDDTNSGVSVGKCCAGCILCQ